MSIYHQLSRNIPTQQQLVIFQHHQGHQGHQAMSRKNYQQELPLTQIWQTMQPSQPDVQHCLLLEEATIIDKPLLVSSASYLLLTYDSWVSLG